MRIGVVMPTYNQAAYLKDAVDSVMAQTVPIQGPVIVEDGSTDSTPEVLSAMRVRYVRNGENIGAARSINAGVVVLRGLNVDAISWVSSDNRMYPNWLEKLSEALRPGVGAVYSAFDTTTPEGKKITIRQGPYSKDRLASSENCYFGPSFLIRSEIWRAAGDHEGGSAHDYGHWARVEEACWAAGLTIEYVDEPLCFYRQHPEQTVKRRPGLYDAPEQRRKALERRAKAVLA